MRHIINLRNIYKKIKVRTTASNQNKRAKKKVSEKMAQEQPRPDPCWRGFGVAGVTYRSNCCAAPKPFLIPKTYL